MVGVLAAGGFLTVMWLLSSASSARASTVEAKQEKEKQRTRKAVKAHADRADKAERAAKSPPAKPSKPPAEPVPGQHTRTTPTGGKVVVVDPINMTAQVVSPPAKPSKPPREPVHDAAWQRAQAEKLRGLQLQRERPKPLKPKPKPRPAPRPEPTFPARRGPLVTVPVDFIAQPAARSAEQAARDLLAHARELTSKGQSSRLGTKGAPNQTVLAAQRDMGGGIAADGIYGPATRARGKALLGTTFPAR